MKIVCNFIDKIIKFFKKEPQQEETLDDYDCTRTS